MTLNNITNWKQIEVIDSIEIVSANSIEFRNHLLETLGLPIPKFITGLKRNETNIDWNLMPNYHSFYYDDPDQKETIRNLLEISDLSKFNKIIITYGWKEPMIKIPTHLFLEDWEGFLSSTGYETIIFSEDYSLIIESSRDYYIHSNFKIL